MLCSFCASPALLLRSLCALPERGDRRLVDFRPGGGENCSVLRRVLAGIAAHGSGLSGNIIL